MNQRTAKLLRKVASATSSRAFTAYRNAKARWNTIPRNRRWEAREKLKEVLIKES